MPETYELNEQGELVDRTYVRDYADLVYSLGCMLEDRMALDEGDQARLWSYLRGNLDMFYERIGPIMDEVTEELFPGAEW